VPAINDPKAVERAKVGRHRLRDPRAQPRRVFVTGYVGEIHDCQCVFAGDCGWSGGLDRRRRVGLHDFDRRNKAVAAPSDSLDELWRSRIVAESITQFGDGLRQRVVSYVRVGPERVEQLFFCNQRAGIVEQVEQQVEKLGCDVQRLGASEDAIADPIGQKRTEPIRRTRHF
jgi:hypothetical protein